MQYRVYARRCGDFGDHNGVKNHLIYAGSTFQTLEFAKSESLPRLVNEKYGRTQIMYVDVKDGRSVVKGG